MSPIEHQSPRNNPAPQRIEFFTRAEAREIMSAILGHCRQRGADIIEEEVDYFVIELDGRSAEVFFSDENILKEDGPPYNLNDLGSIQVESDEPSAPGCGYGKSVGFPGEEHAVTAELIVKDPECSIPYLLGTK